MPTIYFDSMEEAVREACYQKDYKCAYVDCDKCGLSKRGIGECAKFAIESPLEALKLLTGDDYKIRVPVKSMADELCNLCNKYGDCGKCPLYGVKIGQTRETMSCPFDTAHHTNGCMSTIYVSESGCRMSEKFISMAYEYVKRIEDERK